MPRFCGKKQGKPTLQSDGAFFRVTFRSNHVYDAQGFRAVYVFHKGKSKLAIFCLCNCYKTSQICLYIPPVLQVTQILQPHILFV